MELLVLRVAGREFTRSEPADFRTLRVYTHVPRAYFNTGGHGPGPDDG